MGEINRADLEYLNEKEIIELYELFFGSILIKKPASYYYENLFKSLQKEDPVNNVISRLNEKEQLILNTLSFYRYIPYNYLTEKLSIILDEPLVSINRSLGSLIEKKYIFLRNNDSLVIPNIFFREENPGIEIKKAAGIHRKKSNKALIDINNLMNCFVSKEIKFSNNFNLYKRDIDTVKEIFSSYSQLDDMGLTLTGYFFCLSFTDDENNIIMNNFNEYHTLPKEKKILFFLKMTFPWFYNLLKDMIKQKISIFVSPDNFEKIFIQSFLLTDYEEEPFKINFDDLVAFLKKIEIMEENKKEDMVVFPVYPVEDETDKKQIKITSSYNFYINADSAIKNFFLPAFFADFVKYNQIVEYEITENAIKRCARYNIVLEEIIKFFKDYGMDVPKNVETTIGQWLEKYGSYYYTNGLVFICQTPEKGRIINTLINKGLIKAYEIKKNEVFLIPEDDKIIFFNFLEKSGIYYDYKNPQRVKQLARKNNINLFEIIHFNEL